MPTLKEKGYNVLFGSARAIVAPKGTPDEIINILHTTFKTALGSTRKCRKI